jgi:signal transduction histidine kinase
MDTICGYSAIPSTSSTNWHAGGRAMGQDADQVHADQVRDDFCTILLAMVGHDLRQPLQVIANAHDILTRTAQDDKVHEELARAEDATAQLVGMFGQIVEALQLHERSSSRLPVAVPVRPLLDKLAAEFAETARLKGISFRVTAAGDAALTHPVLFASMLRNLIRNAVDHTPRGGSVSVASCSFGSKLRIEVRDTGVGIRASALPRIFDAFERADDGGADGLGLGLFIVKHAADLLGHRVEVHSVEGCGARFAIVADAVSCRNPEPGWLEGTVASD